MNFNITLNEAVYIYIYNYIYRVMNNKEIVNFQCMVIIVKYKFNKLILTLILQ